MTSRLLLFAALLAIGCSRGEPPPAPAPRETGLPLATVSTGGTTDSARESGEQDGTTAKGSAGRKLALLVGCTRYDNLAERFSLKGPGNDVVLMRKVLTGRFGFADKHIVTLADVPGAAGRPTRANIKSQFERLAKEAKAGDQVMIVMGGHGSQQPERVAGSESDGLDETFLPCDAGPWDGSNQAVTNAIIDDEFEVWTSAITDRGASLFLVLDCCHSGTLLRGGDEVLREIAEGDLVPQQVLDRARKGAAARRDATRGGEAKAPTARPENKTPRLVALYACQRHEPTVERPMPPDGGEQRYGLLSYTVCQILTQAQSSMTYRELAQRVQAQYVQWGRVAPTPLLDGPDQDREVLGTRAWPDRSKFILARSEDGWKIRAGLLHGLTEGSILAVYPPPGKANADQIIGHIRVQKSEPTEAAVEPCAHAKMAATKELAEGGRCDFVYVDYGSMRLRVGAETAGNDETETHRRVRKMLAAIGKASESLIEPAAGGQKADVLVRIKGDKLFLVAADVAQLVGTPPPGAAYFGPYSANQPQKVQDDLTKIARARNLLKLVSVPSATAEDQADLEIEMVKLKDKTDKKGEKLQWEKKGLALKPGDLVGWRVTNRGKTILDVTLLFIDSSYGIDSVFPRRSQAGSGENRFVPGQSFLVGPARVDPKTVGLEHMLMIAVKGEGQPVDFTCLAQPSLEKAEYAATRGGGKPALATPLGRLLKNAVYAQGASRGINMVEADTQVLRLLSWTVAPMAAAKKK
jgi:Caspase domain